MSRLGLLALVVVLLVPGSALAQDFGPLAPADRAAVPVDPDGIPVTFTCPNYGLFGNPSTYGATLSTSSALVSGRADPSAPGQCAVALGAGGSPPRIQETPGSYYWQVWRICTECPSGYETAPVRALTLASAVDPKLTVPARVYGGYPFIATVAVAGAPDGSAVMVERGSKEAGSGVALGGKAEIVITLPKGTHTLRTTLTLGSSPAAGATTRVTARAAKGWTTTKSDGNYKGKAGSRGVSFKVAKKGRELRDFRAFVPLTCPGITPGTFTTQIGTALLARVKIAPDGAFVMAWSEEGVAIRLRGRLKGRRVTGGRAEMSQGACVGNTVYSASR